MIDPLEVAQREFDTALGRFFGGRMGEMTNGNQQTGWAPFGVDIREDQDHFYVEAELPGFKKDEIEITLENQTLTITAEKRYENQQANAGNAGNGGRGATNSETQPQGDYLLRERRWSRFQRSFTLPPTVDEASVNAKLTDGVLTITLNKRDETKPRKISVS